MSTPDANESQRFWREAERAVVSETGAQQRRRRESEDAVDAWMSASGEWLRS